MEITASDLTKEFIHGGFLDAAIGLIVSALPAYRDPDFGVTDQDIRAMRRDAAVISALDTLTLGVLADGITISPAMAQVPQWRRERAAGVTDPAERQAIFDGESSAETARFLRGQIATMEGELLDVAENLLEGMCYGWQSAEAVYRYIELGPDKDKLGLRSLTAKPRSQMTPILDKAGRIVGFLAHAPAGAGAIVPGGDVTKSPNFVPALKFATYIHRPRPGQPLGQCLLAPAYNPWFVKVKILPDFLRYLKQFASPAIIGKLPPGAVDEILRNAQGIPMTDASGQPITKKAVQVLLGHLIGWLNSSVLALPHGTEVDLVKSEGNGEAFREAGDWFDRQIHLAILGTPQASLEAQAESRSSKGVAQDLLGLRIRYIRRRLGNALTDGVAWPLTVVNYGERMAPYVPKILLASAEQQDQLAKVEAYTKAKAGGLIYPTQEPWVYDDLGWPQPDWDAEKARQEAKEEQEREDARERGRMFRPDGGGDPA
ncbi:MAG: phage portal protein family protein [Fimbriimonas sp.]